MNKKALVRLSLGWLIALSAQAQEKVANDETIAREVFRKGVAAFQAKNFAEAEKELQQVPELGGYLSLYKHWFLGQTYLELGKLKEAEPEFRKVIASRASTELKYQAQFLLGETALRQGHFADASRQLNPLERKWRRSYRLPEVLFRLLTAELKTGRLMAACKHARTLYTRYPAHASVLHWGSLLSANTIEGKPLPCTQANEDFARRVRSLQWSGESEKAHKEISDQIAKTAPDQRLNLDLILAGFLVNEGSTDDALNLLIRYYPQQKANVSYLMLLGKAAARSGEYQTAVGAYERAHSLSRGSRQGREALFQAAYLSYQFQDYDGAVRKFQRFAKANPRSGLARDAQWHLAWLQYLRNDFKGALERFEQVRSRFQNSRRVSEAVRERVYYWSGMANVRLSRWEAARDAFTYLVNRNSFSYYGMAAHARLDAIRPQLAELKTRIPSAQEPQVSVKVGAAPEEEKESEEEIAEEKNEELPLGQEEPVDDEGMQATQFKDPEMRARIEVAQKLIEMGLVELARWELWEVERRTRNPQFLRHLIASYEGIGSYHRSATIAELSFAREREQMGLENGRALWQSMYPQAYKNWVTNGAKEFSVPEEWVWSIMRAESLYKTDVISPVGAKGLMQLMPFTAANLHRLNDRSKDQSAHLDLLVPETNIFLGAQYLGRLSQKFKGVLPLVAAAYNAGPHRVEGWLVNFGHMETDEFVEHIPFLETRNYVKKVVRNHTLYRRIYAKDAKSVDYLAKALGVPIPTRAATRESWESL